MSVDAAHNEHDIKRIKDLLSRQELEFLDSCKSKAINQFMVGALLGGSVTWIITKRLGNILRISFSLGSAGFFGIWRFRLSLYRSFDHCLSHDGTTLQSQSAVILLEKFRNVPWLKQLIFKHFYSESLFDDSSSSEEPVKRWRFRNHFDESLIFLQKTSFSSYSSMDSHIAEPDPGLKQLPVSSSSDAVSHPLDWDPEHHESWDDTPTMAPPRVVTRRNRRERRRHRMHRRHKDGSLDVEI